MNASELRKKFFDFFHSRNHKIVPSSSLLFNNKTVLFTIAGMQQFSPYLSGEKDPMKRFGTRHLASCQKCFRTNDIDRVGDDTHHTFFEMLGNWSIGQDENGYFKEGAIRYALEFLTQSLGLDKKRLWVSVFKGEGKLPRDNKAVAIWRRNGIPLERIKYFGSTDNFWGPVAEEGPCGPCSEIFYNKGEIKRADNHNIGFPSNVVEIWNLVFMEYFKDNKGHFELLKQTNIDTGIGLERLVAILEDKPSAYETDLFWPIIEKLEGLTGIDYLKLSSTTKEKKYFRIVADHIRGAVFLISDGALPSNIAQGYVLRRILRRAMRYGRLLGAPKNFLIPLAEIVVRIYQNQYPNLSSKKEEIVTVIQNEEERFEKTLTVGLKELYKVIHRVKKNNLGKSVISGEQAFTLYQSYGFPLEMIKQIAKENGLAVDEKEFSKDFKKHQEISRAGMSKKFGGHGIEKVKNKQEREKITRLHTATHLLQAALRRVLGSDVQQVGSDISQERLRFDFTFPRKLTRNEISEIENLVNEKIKEDLLVKKEEMSLKKALRSGALAFFKAKYPPIVSVYSIGNFSKEVCAGPHVSHTGLLGHFQIIKEESCGSGKRRIKAILD